MIPIKIDKIIFVINIPKKPMSTRITGSFAEFFDDLIKPKETAIPAIEMIRLQMQFRIR